MYGSFVHPFAPPRRSEFYSFVDGNGALLYDDAGREYVDGMAALWYMNIGYGRQEMVDAIAEQASKLSAHHMFDNFTMDVVDRAADAVVAKSPLERSRVFFANSGSEAVDTALKTARIAHREAGNPQKHIIISRERGYHGVNYGGTSAQGIPGNRDGFGPFVGGIINVPADNPEAMAAVFDQHGDEIAAVLTEPIQGAGGVFPAPPGYLEGLRRLCDTHGAYLIFDEVITGWGRTGHWFAADHYNVMPDMITFAKAVTSGYVPFSGVLYGPKVLDALEANEGFVFRHGYTYSGHPLGAAAAIAAIGIQERENLPGRAPHIGARIEAGLHSMRADGLVVDVRGVGAVWGVTVPEGVNASVVRQTCLDSGLILRAVGDHIVMCPPLVISDEQVDFLIDTLADALG